MAHAATVAGGAHALYRGGVSDMLRIGMVCPYSLSIPGGVQQQVLALSRALRARGHEVRVLGPCDGPPPAPFVTPVGNSLPAAVNGSVAPLAPDPSAALRTIRALNDEAFDVLHVHEPMVPGPALTACVMKLGPIVGTFHAAGESIGYKVFQRQLRHLLDRIDISVAVSKDARELVNRYFKGECEILFNGIEIDQYSPRDGVAKENAIFFVGRHEPRKGLQVLLEAVEKMPDDVRVWVASDGPETESLKEKFAHLSKVEWLGRISDEEKIDRLQRSSVFCAPSLRGESFGVVLLEAMAAGTPVVASGLDGYKNVATHDVDSLLVEPGNVDALVSALSRVIVDPRLSARLVAAGRERAATYSMDSLASHYEALYHKALELEATNSIRASRPRMLKRFESRILRRSRGVSEGVK